MENEPVEETKRKTKQQLKREKKLAEMLAFGRELYLSSDGKDFSLRAVARKMKMPASNMYNYFKDKRELWYAMLNQEYYAEVIDFLTAIKTNPVLDFLEKIESLFSFIFDYARQDFDRYRMMFIATPPKSKDGQKGKYEKQFTFSTGEIVYSIIAQSIALEGIPEKNPLMLYRYIASLISGSIQMVAQLVALDPAFDAEQTMSYVKDAFIQQYRAFIRT
ncbi:MAG: TetR/AcrR family transcriptional regulator [Candidatus Heimdallarchaeota archaeon]|nr:TetR/AcrR family transcriptional regulator [Candidatus Heimdallarchaeota archaeon]